MQQIKLTPYQTELFEITRARHNLDVKGDTVLDVFKAFYLKHYGLDPEKYEYEFYETILNSLFKLYCEAFEGSQEHLIRMIQDLFKFSFHKTISRDQDNPKERVIMELYGRIQCFRVIYDDHTRRIIYSEYENEEI